MLTHPFVSYVIVWQNECLVFHLQINKKVTTTPLQFHFLAVHRNYILLAERTCHFRFKCSARIAFVHEAGRVGEEAYRCLEREWGLRGDCSLCLPQRLCFSFTCRCTCILPHRRRGLKSNKKLKPSDENFNILLKHSSANLHTSWSNGNKPAYLIHNTIPKKATKLL